MAGVVTTRLHGFSGGVVHPAGGSDPGLRGEVTGWSIGAARRNAEFLQSVDLDSLGFAECFTVTLTLRENPETAEQFHGMRTDFIKRLRRRGLVRAHWVIEWTRKGTAHLHMYVEMSEGFTEEHLLPVWWVQIAQKSGAVARAEGQHVARVWDALGWLKYSAKHASRGVNNYQRQGVPKGWKKTGRVWGKIGQWETEEPGKVELTLAEFHRFRRLVRHQRIAEARQAGRWKALARARRMLKNPDPKQSTVKGIGGWNGALITYDLLVLAVNGEFRLRRRIRPSEIEERQGVIR